MFKELVKKTRSYRRFQRQPAPSLQQLEQLIDLARQTPSANNNQPLKYVLVNTENNLEQVFSCLAWAGYLTDWPGPSPQERPTAYIIVLNDPQLSTSADIDVGIATQTILLGAQTLGFGGCPLGSVERPRLQKLLRLPANLEIKLVIALGAPGEKVALQPLPQDGDTRYFRDENEVHHVPKRQLQDLIIARF